MDFSQFADKEVKETKIIPEKSTSGTNNIIPPKKKIDIPLQEADSKGDGFGTVELARKVLAAPDIKSAKEVLKEAQSFGAPTTTEKFFTPPTKTPFKPTAQPKITKREEVINEHFEIVESKESFPLDITMEQRQAKILEDLALIEFTAKSVLNVDDWWLPPSAKKKALTRSGCNKLAAIFKISTETISIEVRKEIDLHGKEDVLAYAKVKATRPGGSYVIAEGVKALSEYGRGASKMKMKDLKATAETRASNRAIQNALGFVPKGFSVVTKEEIKGGGGFGA